MSLKTRRLRFKFGVSVLGLRFTAGLGKKNGKEAEAERGKRSGSGMAERRNGERRNGPGRYMAERK